MKNTTNDILTLLHHLSHTMNTANAIENKLQINNYIVFNLSQTKQKNYSFQYLWWKHLWFSDYQNNLEVMFSL